MSLKNNQNGKFTQHIASKMITHLDNFKVYEIEKKIKNKNKLIVKKREGT